MQETKDCTSNTDITVKCQLSCGIPLKPIAPHLWEKDLRPVGLSLRVSFSHPWFSMWWEPLSFFNTIVWDSQFKSVHAVPGFLRHGSHGAFKLKARLFLALGTLGNQGSSAGCPHLPSRWGNRADCEYCSLEKRSGKCGGADGASPCGSVLLFWVLGGVWRRAGLRLQVSTRDGLLLLLLQSPRGLAISEASLFFFGSQQGTFCRFQRRWHRQAVGAQLSSFFHPVGIFFSLSHPTWGWLLKGSFLWSLALAHEKEIYYTEGCYFQRLSYRVGKSCQMEVGWC